METLRSDLFALILGLGFALTGFFQISRYEEIISSTKITPIQIVNWGIGSVFILVSGILLCFGVYLFVTTLIVAVRSRI